MSRRRYSQKDWHTDLERGQRGEALWQKHINSFNSFDIVKTDPETDETGVDFFITRKSTGETSGVDVKNDNEIAKWGNLVFEHHQRWNDGSKEKQGWMHKCTSDYIVWLNEQHNMYYLVSVDEMCSKLDYIQQVGKPKLVTREHWKTTEIFLIPVKDMPKHFDSFQTGRLN